MLSTCKSLHFCRSPTVATVSAPAPPGSSGSSRVIPLRGEENSGSQSSEEEDSEFDSEGKLN